MLKTQAPTLQEAISSATSQPNRPPARNSSPTLNVSSLLLEINQEQAEKIQHILVGETKATIRAERRQQWLFFALGAMVSIPIGVAINVLIP